MSIQALVFIYPSVSPLLFWTPFVPIAVLSSVWSPCFFTFLSPCQIHVSVSMCSSYMLVCHLFCYFLSYLCGPLSLCILCGSLSCLHVYLSLVLVSSSFVLVSVSVCVCPVSSVSCVLGFSSTSPVSLFCAWCQLRSHLFPLPSLPGVCIYCLGLSVLCCDLPLAACAPVLSFCH